MKVNRIKWKILLCVFCIIMVFGISSMEIAAAAEEEETAISEEATESNKKESNKKESIQASKESSTDKLSAGAAVLLDADISMKDEEIVEIVKSKTTEQETVTKEKEKNTGLVMARVNEYVNIRKDANQDSDKVGVLYKDCGGQVLEQADGWTKISSGDVKGWVKNEFLYFGEEAQNLAKEVGILTAVTNTETLRVRKEPDKSAGVFGLLANNEAVEAIAEEGDWVSISYEGATGYVAAEYVTVNFEIDKAESIEAIREREAKEAEAKRKAQKEAVMASTTEVDILAALIQCEAGGESYEGQIAVGAVVMNRVRSGSYPNSITGVIYASGQFTPASTGKMDNLIMTGNIKQSCRQAAQEVINGACNVGEATRFRRVGSKQGLIIGNHVFW